MQENQTYKIRAMNTIIGNGIDIVECSRIDSLIKRHGQRFLERIFTQAELDYCMNRKREIEHLAGRFAAKEAILKVIGTGWRGEISWKDMEIVNDSAGKPEIKLTGKTAEIANQLGIERILLTISHTENYAVASAIAIGNIRQR